MHYFAIKHDINDVFFKTPDSLEQKPYLILIFDWLVRKYDLPAYQHSFKDQFMSYNIWSDTLSISFDFRCQEQVDLFEKLPTEIKGTKQYKTGKLVNVKSLYFKVSDLINFQYPDIIKYELIYTEKSKDNDGDDFRSYTYKIYLSDGTGLYHLTQDTEEIISKEYTYPAKIQERAFCRFLRGLKK